MSDSLPPEPFAEPAEARDTEPPLNPAMVQALRDIVREELERVLAPLAKTWGDAFVAQRSFAERVEEKADNALANSGERDRVQTDRWLAVHEDLRALRRHLQLPEHGSIADLASRGGE